jgi:2'-hydroxyisoflavone reductase
MRVLVIGGTQFMGREAVQRLVERGHDVAVLHRGGTHDLGPAVRNIAADRGDTEAMTRILQAERSDAVLDFAYDWERGTTAAQVEAAARACPDSLRRYVFVSSIAAYGGGIDLREDHPLAPDDHPNPYVQHKASAERALFRMHAATGFPVVTFRPPFVHGPRQPFYREQFFWDRLRDGRAVILPDGGHAPMQWVYAATWRRRACARSRWRQRPARPSTLPTSSRRRSARLSRHWHGWPASSRHSWNVPRDVILAAGGHPFMGNLYFGEMLDLPPHTSNVQKAERMLGITPTPLDVALRVSFRWYLGQPRRPVDYTFEDGLLLLA